MTKKNLLMLSIIIFYLSLFSYTFGCDPNINSSYDLLTKSGIECEVQKNKWGQQNIYIEKTFEDRPEVRLEIACVKNIKDENILILRFHPINPQAAILDGYVTISDDNTLKTYRVSQTEITLMRRDGNGRIHQGIPLFTDSIDAKIKNARSEIEFLELYLDMADNLTAPWKSSFIEAFFIPDLHEIKLQSGRIRCSFLIDRKFAECMEAFVAGSYAELEPN